MIPRVLILLCMSLLLVCLLKVEVIGLQRIRRAGRHRHDEREMEYKCLYRNQLINCANNPIIVITKSDHYYWINITRLVDGIEWIECKEICKDCESLMGQG